MTRTGRQGPRTTALPRALAWTGGAFVVMSVAGLALNVLIARVDGAAVLGVFAQASAVFFIAGLIASFGVQVAVLHHVSRDPDARAQVRAVAAAGVALALLFGLLTAGLVWLLAPAFGAATGSPATAPAVQNLAPALVFCGVNKVLIHLLNGQGRIRAMSTMQMGRYVGVVLSLAGLLATDAEPGQLTLAYAIAEGALSIALLFATWRDLRPPSLAAVAAWLRPHAAFGAKSVVGDTAYLINIQIDTLMIGVFLPDREVGIYTIASQVALAFVELLTAVSYPLAPRMARLAELGRPRVLARWARRWVRAVYLWGVPVALVAAAAYPLVPRLVIADPAFEASYTAFLILLGGCYLMSGYRPFMPLLPQIGRPGTYTLLRLAAMALNVALNAALIPILGIEGAALATAVNFVFTALALRWLATRALGHRF